MTVCLDRQSVTITGSVHFDLDKASHVRAHINKELEKFMCVPVVAPSHIQTKTTALNNKKRLIIRYIC